ncbi:recombination protein NinG [Candidatus Symbiopectobacterium sp. NZEC135]|uniref:recombination protein NinG n=1 Tax=Candidatus Symbiopectobacterium sp. NZEC135 TaxID=2820471 RepID=UPI002226B627|nr:recombination protein NinG [Candidatus Symbiopectobacterium sp. NZEC135]MCW2477734.1 recombination protein NinG [Candidatus Symbiopectobacterium sp. NZEC135]
MAKTIKNKTCPICSTEYIPRNSLQKACYSITCAMAYAEQQKKLKAEREALRQAKLQRDDLKRRREALKTKSDWNKEAQAAVNRFIFWRDYGRPCIACGKPLNYGVRGGAVDASHYRSRGSAAHLRFNIFNNHAGCVHCNRDLSGNLIPYRINLIEKIGLHRVERLEHDNTPRKFDIAYLQRVKAIFTRRARHYEKLRKRQMEEAA